MRQAEADLQHAAWSCVAAQQAAGPPRRGLPAEIVNAVGEDLLDAARALDKDYIQSRYPNGFAAGAPFDYFTEQDAQQSIANAKSILSFCGSRIRRP